MGANRRNYYGECAAYIAAIGEVKEKLGEKKCKADLYVTLCGYVYKEKCL